MKIEKELYCYLKNILKSINEDEFWIQINGRQICILDGKKNENHCIRINSRGADLKELRIYV